MERRYLLKLLPGGIIEHSVERRELIDRVLRLPTHLRDKEVCKGVIWPLIRIRLSEKGACTKEVPGHDASARATGFFLKDALSHCVLSKLCHIYFAMLCSCCSRRSSRVLGQLEASS